MFFVIIFGSFSFYFRAAPSQHCKPQPDCINPRLSSLAGDRLHSEGPTVSGDAAAWRGASRAGDGASSSVTGGGEVGGRPAAPPAAQGSGRWKQLRRSRTLLITARKKVDTQERLLYF